MVPTRVYAATTNTYEGFEYEVNTNENNKEVTITKYTGSDASVTVPDTIDGLPVTRVGERAFNANGQIVSVQIGKNVKSIGRYAFSSSGNLKTVQLSNAVTILERGAFSDCKNLKEIIWGMLLRIVQIYRKWY